MREHGEDPVNGKRVGEKEKKNEKDPFTGGGGEPANGKETAIKER